MTGRSAEGAVSPKSWNFIVYLRVVCALTVAYNHLGAMRHPEWAVTRLLQFLLNRPLNLVQNFGALAVCMFFLISGFLAAGGLTKKRLSLRDLSGFLWRRGKRIFLPLGVCMAAGFATVKLYSALLGRETCFSGFTKWDWLRSALLLNQWQGLPDYVNGALWYLLPLLVFYLLYAVAVWLSGKHNTAGGILAFDLIYGIAMAYISRVPWFNLFPFAIMPLFGAILRLKFQEKISFRSCSALFAVNWVLMITAFYTLAPNFYGLELYLVSFAFCVLIFLVMALLDDRIPAPSRVWTLLSGISYEFYCIHCVVGGFSMWLLELGGVPTTLAVTVSVLLSAVWGWGCHELTEILPGWIRNSRK